MFDGLGREEGNFKMLEAVVGMRMVAGQKKLNKNGPATKKIKLNVKRSETSKGLENNEIPFDTILS